MNRILKTLSDLKISLAFSYIGFGILFLILAILLFLVFILQGALSIHAPFYLVPLYLLPITLTSFLFSLLLLRLLKRKQILRLSATFSALMLTLAISFQLLKVDPYFGKVELVGPFKDNFPEISISSTFPSRLAASLAESLKLLPLSRFDRELVIYGGLTLKGALLSFGLKDYFMDEALSKTCSHYRDSYLLYGSCIPDLYKALYEKRELSSSGNILLVATGALAVFKSKDSTLKTFPDKKDEVLVKHFLDLMDVTHVALSKAKEILDTPVSDSTPFGILIDKEIEFEHYKVGSKTFNLPPQIELKAKKVGNPLEIKRANDLKIKIETLNIDKVLEANKNLGAQIETTLKRYKSQSLIFSLCETFDQDFETKLFEFISSPDKNQTPPAKTTDSKNGKGKL